VNPAQEIFAKALALAGRSTALKNLVALVPEVSTRRYYRLTLADGTTLVGVHEDATTARTNMPLVSQIQGFLKSGGVSIPEVLYADAETGVMLQQDLGDMSLSQVLRENPDQIETLYQEAIRHMFGWQRLPDDGNCPAFNLSFDVAKLIWEFNFFIEHTLMGYHGAQLSETDLFQLRGNFTRIAEALAAPANKVFTHRDYHSRNIMVLDDRQYIIDFQDARLGLFQYDLSSLLYDSYAPIEKTLRTKLIDFAFKNGKDIHKQTRAEFDEHLRLSAFQRLVKALGTYGRQAALGRHDFEMYLEPAWQMLAEITSEDVKLRGITFRLESLIEHH
jgi:N-acetylmuramate 1-kinase